MAAKKKAKKAKAPRAKAGAKGKSLRNANARATGSSKAARAVAKQPKAKNRISSGATTRTIEVKAPIKAKAPPPVTAAKPPELPAVPPATTPVAPSPKAPANPTGRESKFILKGPAASKAPPPTAAVRPQSARHHTSPDTGYALAIDGRVKSHYQTAAEAYTAGSALKSKFPVLDVVVLDVASSVRTRIEPAKAGTKA